MVALPTVDQVVAQLDERGYTWVEGMLPPEQVASMRDELTEVLAATATGRNDFEGARTRRIDALFAKTRCFDRPAIHPLVLGVTERVLGHCHLSAPTGIEIGPGEVEANGATRVVPGSHRWPNGQMATAADTIAVEMPAGSVSFYLSSIRHGGGANHTDLPRSVARTLPEPLLELLGYNIRPPFIGYVDGRHPLRALRDPTLD